MQERSVSNLPYSRLPVGSHSVALADWKSALQQVGNRLETCATAAAAYHRVGT